MRVVTAAPVRATAQSGLPPHVRTAFGVNEIEPRPVEWAGRRAWHCGDILIRAVADNAVAAWSAGVLDTLEVPGVRIAKPVRSSDGRWVIAGWAASRFVPGTLEPRYDEVVAVAEKLHAVMADLPRPRLLENRDDLVTRSAAAAFGELRVTVDRSHGGALFDHLAAYRRPVHAEPQVVHPELFGAVLFDGDAPPAIVDLVPCWRPPAWAAAVIVVDALAWGGADEGLIHRWAHLPEWPQMLLRAVLHRIVLHAQHPDGGPRTLAGLERAAGLVSALV
ncbi:TIGR02569 family protein [Pseudonocardia thermophila]|uniref:TIGR02569 family protein n=1 Tax=Pseudonocardia thermophila TaxID=1848 RepID=A0A1M6WBQ9_PSETH|nr:TIGR02569 family protein [Pseudonocardia thermophila]